MKIKFDPTGKYKERRAFFNKEGMAPAIGLIGFGDNDSFVDNVNANYPFGAHWRPVGQYKDSIDEDGTYRYPEDEPLYPLFRLTHNGKEAYFYPHDIVVAKDSAGVWQFGRID